MKGAGTFIRVQSGFSLIEVLIVVSVVGILVGIFTISVSSIRKTSKRAKLLSDVRLLNSAVISYIGMGGNPDALEDTDAVLWTLKKSLPEVRKEFHVGLGRESLIDKRITYRAFQSRNSSEEALHAYWDRNQLLFKVTVHPHPRGIAEFYLQDDLALVDYGEDHSRENVFTYAEKSGWIWDYVEASPDPHLGPTEIAVHRVQDAAAPAPIRSRDPKWGRDGASRVSGGIALNLGPGSANADGGVALNLLSTDAVDARSGEVAVGILGTSLSIGGEDHVSGSGQPQGSSPNESSGTLPGPSVNLGKGEAIAIEGIAANIGDGRSSAEKGIASNLGGGNSSAEKGISGNFGKGEASATQGIGINFGSGSAEAGSKGE